MGGNVESIKERLDIAEVIGSYIPLQKAGANFKAKCPFHNEKTASFFISESRQSYYCFGCGVKGDIFTFVEEQEGLDFKGALKLLADKAGIQLKFEKTESRKADDKLIESLEAATSFFEEELEKNNKAREYLKSRGVNKESIKLWRIGFAPDEWRSLFSYLTQIGFDEATLLRAGLVKRGEEKERTPYDVFRNRIIFPLFDPSGKVVAFSGRALDPETLPKYLNSPDTPLFKKSELLYGLDKAKSEIRKKNYSVLVEGQMDLVLSHQALVKNTVATSGTAFTNLHLERLKRLSSRILLAFDADQAGEKASERSAELAMSLGLEVKIASLQEGKDPADLVRESEDKWKDSLRASIPAIEHFLNKIVEREKDTRKIGQEIIKKILPLVSLLRSSIEQSHFVSLITKKTGIKEEIIWDDLKRIKVSVTVDKENTVDKKQEAERRTLKERVEDKLNEVVVWIEDLPEDSDERKDLKKEADELRARLSLILMEEEIATLKRSLLSGEEDALLRIQQLNSRLDEEKRKIV
ncbi:DNA primase [Candidatus Parcubacteria bacterium]|nr:DNA primase [Candidatus Parcubacteria bacterium]